VRGGCASAIVEVRVYIIEDRVKNNVVYAISSLELGTRPRDVSEDDGSMIHVQLASHASSYACVAEALCRPGANSRAACGRL